MKAILATLRAERDGVIVGAAVFLFHLSHVAAVAHGGVFARDNLAFDFDIGRFVSLWAATPFDVAQNAPYYAVRHPLAVLPRLVGRPLVAAGIDPRVGACAIAAACAAASAVLTLRMARLLDVRRAPALLMTALWAVSTAPLLLGVLPEAYGLALAALSWQMLIAVRWARGEAPALPTRIAAAVVNLGITVTNVVLAGLIELVHRLARQPVRRALIATAGFGAAVAVVAVVLGAVSFRVWPVDGIATSGGAARELYWSASFAEGDTSRQSPAAVAWTLGAIGFVAPAVAAYPTGVAGNPYLYDLRGFDYDAIGWVAVAGWIALLLFGIVAAARDRALRPLWIVAAGWAVANVLLHSHWHFRKTVFLYAAHPHVGFFVLALAGARWAETRRPRVRACYAVAVALVTLATAAANIPLYLALPRLD